MPLSSISLFISTPIPWATILCIVLYRHDLSQLVHPMKDRCSIRDWKSVLDDLDIPPKKSSMPPNRGEKAARADFSIFERFRAGILEKHPDMGYYAMTLAIVSTVSLLSSFVIVPLLVGQSSILFSRFSLIFSAVFQFVSAIPSIFAMERCFGPFPSPSRKYHLQKRRQGSLVRYE